jgi:large subunit ribosomal protein L18
MDHQKAKRKQQLRRRRHVRRGIVGTPERPRLSVFRSNKHIYAQLIDDLTGTTLASASSNTEAMLAQSPHGGNVKVAAVVGKALAEAAKAKGIDKAAFDRGHYKFHGRVKALAEAANAAGLKCCEPKKPPKEPPPPAPEAEAKPADKPKKEGKKEAKKEKVNA